MKAINLFFIISLSAFFAIPSFPNEKPKDPPNDEKQESTDYVSSERNPSQDEATLVLKARLNEINNLDKSGLTSKEKRALRSEVNTIKSKLAAGSGGIYLSVGGLLLIIILLIILL